MADLARHIRLAARVRFHGGFVLRRGDEDDGVVRILKDLDHDLDGLDVLLVEDIVDSGPHAQVPAEEPRSAQARVARGGRPAAEGRACRRCRSTCATSGSTSRRSSWSATASTSRSATGTFRTSRRSSPRPTAAPLSRSGTSPTQRERRRRMRRRSAAILHLALVVALVLVACGGAWRRPIQADSGVRGVVTAGPQCPVVAAGLAVPRSSHGRGPCAITDADGRGRRGSDRRRRALRGRARALATYVVVAVTEAGRPPMAPPQKVVVPDGQ